MKIKVHFSSFGVKESIDSESCAYLPAQLEGISGATRRQVGEWIRRGVIAAPNVNPGRGNTRTYSFWNLMEAIIAANYGKFAHMQILANSMDQLRVQKDVIFKWLNENLPQDLDAGEMRLLADKLALYMLISADPAAISEKVISPIVRIGMSREGLLLSSGKRKKMMPNTKVFRDELPPVEVCVNLTWVFLKAIAGEINLRVSLKR